MTSRNWEKQYKDWYTQKFMRACALYAVVHDMSIPKGTRKDGSSADWNYKKALEKETEFKIPTPQLNKEHESGSAPPVEQTNIGAQQQPQNAYDRVRQGFFSGKGEYSFWQDAATLTDEQIAAGGTIRKQMFVHGWTKRYKFRTMEPILKTFLEMPAGQPGLWLISEKFKFWGINGSPVYKPRSFNVLMSTIMNAGGSGVDSVFKTLKTVYEASPTNTNRIVPLAYTVPMMALLPNSGELAYGVALQKDYENSVAAPHHKILDNNFNRVHRESYKSRYVINANVGNFRPHAGRRPSSLVVGNPVELGNMTSDSIAEDAFQSLWTKCNNWSGIGVARGELNLTAYQDSDLGKTSPITKVANADIRNSLWELAGHVQATSPHTLTTALREMFLAIGRSKWKTSTGKSWYDQIMYEILWGAQDPTPTGPTVPTPRGGSPRSYTPKAPRNVGKRKLKKGEVHAMNVQCYLLEHIQQLAALRETTTYENVGMIQSGQPGNIVSKLYHGAPQPGKGGVWPPTQGGPDSEAYTLQNMCPDLWALMTPHFELYRVNYLKTTDGKPSLTPISENRIPFSNFLDERDVNEITAGSYGRIGGAGMTSFTWSLDGTQPAEVDNMISAQLTMHFQSVYDLFRHNERPDKPGEFAAGIPGQAGYLDLIIGSGIQGRPTSETANSSDPGDGKAPCEDVLSNEYKGENFRIKVIAGWSTPPGFTNMNIPGYTTKDLEHIKAAIDASRKALFLQIVSHAINFQQDGTLELVIDYQASMSGLTRSPVADIFVGKDIHEDAVAAIDDELAELEEDHNQAILEAGGDTLPSGAETEYQKKQEALLLKQVVLMQKSRAAKYKEFLRSLQKHNKVRAIPVPTKDLLNPLGKMKPEERAEAAKVQLERKFTMASKAQTTKAKTKGELEVNDATNALAADKQQEDNMRLKELADNVGIVATDPGTTVIPFMYLGDLIDALLVSRLPHLIEKDESGTPPMQVVLGNVEMINPLLAYQIKSIKYFCPGAPAGKQKVIRHLSQIDPFRVRKVSGIWEYMNIGSIPISLDKFNEWFVTNIIKKKVESYKLLDFIKDMCSALITDAYSSVCFEKIFKFRLTFNSSNFQMVDSYRGCSATLDQMAHSARNAQARDRARLSFQSKEGPSIPTAVIYSVDSRPRAGDRISDLQEGIYHYYLGGRCGLAKEINFQRQDMPFYREARISKDGALGAQQLKELYTVNMDMIGNTLHKNGTYVYIDPIAIGAGSSRALGGIPNIARLIGLGGYFLVNAVRNEVSPAGFTTTVEAMQEMSSFDTADDDKIVSINGRPPIPREPPPEAHPDDFCGELADEDIDWDATEGPGTSFPGEEDEVEP